MGAGDITILGPYLIGDKTAIDAALTGQAVVADDILCWHDMQYVYFGIVKAT